MLSHLPKECQTLYDNRLVDPIYEKARKESAEFQSFQDQLLKLEVVTYDADDVGNDVIVVNYEKRRSIYGDKITCVGETKDIDCIILEGNISSYKPIESLCGSKNDAGEYYDCRAEERQMQLLRFEKGG